MFQETNFAEREWIAKVRQTLKSIYEIDYEKVVCTSLWGIRCLIVAKPEHMNKISHVQTSSVKTGIGNTLGEWVWSFSGRGHGQDLVSRLG